MTTPTLDLPTAIGAALRAKAASDAANLALARLISAGLARLFPPGTLIDLAALDQASPRCLFGLKCVAGNSRGTRRFRIERVEGVRVNATHIGLTGWTCEATPISEKTGHPMRGSAGNGPGRDTVRLSGYLLPFTEDTSEAEEQRLIVALLGHTEPYTMRADWTVAA